MEQTLEHRLVMITSEQMADIVGCSVAELLQGADDLERRFAEAGARTHKQKIAFLAADNGLSMEVANQVWEEVLEMVR